MSHTAESAFPTQPAAVRAADADREHAADILRTNAGDGRLTPEELSARLDKAFAAQTMGDLQALIADLPEGNVNQAQELIGQIVKTGFGAVKIGLWVGGGATLLGIVVPIAVAIGVTVSPRAGEITAGVILALAAFLAVRISRR